LRELNLDRESARSRLPAEVCALELEEKPQVPPLRCAPPDFL